MTNCLIEVAVLMLAREVLAELGAGHTERVYHNAMLVQLRNHGIPYETERTVPIYFRGDCVGYCAPDIIIDKQIVVELKAGRTITDLNIIQLQRYLNLSAGFKITKGLLLNFTPPGHLEYRRLPAG